MTVFVFEHLVGGAMAAEALPPELANAGLAMLRAAIQDFNDAGHRVVTTLDRRVSAQLGAATIQTVHHPRQFEDTWDKIARSVDAILVIAPESDGHLERWARRTVSLGVASLGCAPDAIAQCADKLTLSQCLHAADLPTPPTSLTRDAYDGPYPAIVKPRFGAGCQETQVVRSQDDRPAMARGDRWIVQPYIQGTPISVSVLAHRGSYRLLPAGCQTITGDNRLHYSGGSVPLACDRRDRAAALAIGTLQAVDTACMARARPSPQHPADQVPAHDPVGLNGFVGVDMILAADPAQDSIIEVNPRLTVSFVALRHLSTTSLAQAMIDPHAPLDWSGSTIRFDADGCVLADSVA